MDIYKHLGTDIHDLTTVHAVAQEADHIPVPSEEGWISRCYDHAKEDSAKVHADLVAQLLAKGYVQLPLVHPEGYEFETYFQRAEGGNAGTSAHVLTDDAKLVGTQVYISYPLPETDDEE